MGKNNKMMVEARGPPQCEVPRGNSVDSLPRDRNFLCAVRGKTLKNNGFSLEFLWKIRIFWNFPKKTKFQILQNELSSIREPVSYTHLRAHET